MTRTNPFTALRLVLVPVLWVPALLGCDRWLGLGLALAALTDVLDGWLARHDRRYEDGRFDSLADKALTLSVVGWLALRRPDIFLGQPWLILAAAVLFAGVQAASWLKFRRGSGLHTHLGKLGGLVQAVFVLHALLAGGYSVVLLYAALGLWGLACAEELAIVLTHDELDEEAVRSIMPYLRRRCGRA